MHGLSLLLLGRRDDAQLHIATAQKLFPDDPGFKIQMALLRTLNDDRAGAQKWVEAGREQLGDGQLETIYMLFDIINLLAHLDDMMTEPDRVNVQMNRALLKANQVWARIGSGRGSGQTLLGTRALLLPPLVETGLGRLFQLMLAMDRVKDDDVRELDGLIGEVGRLMAVRPDGMLLYFQAGLLVRRAEDRDPRWEEAEQAFLQASRAPSIARIQRTALFSAVQIEAFLAHPNWPRQQPGMRARFAGNLRTLLAGGPLPPNQAASLAGSAEKLGEAELARLTLAEWERHWPKDGKAPRQRAAFELRAGAPQLALDAANRALKINASDSEAKELSERAKKKLREPTIRLP